MKTFKLMKIQVVEEDNIRNFTLHDGLIINKEDEHQTWILEAFLDGAETEYFQKLQQSDKNVEILAVISNEKNDPAGLFASVHEVKPIGDKVSVLFSAHMRNQRNEYAEELLAYILDRKDISGDELLAEFKQQMKEKPRIKK
ncbi:hypothetical protein KP77_29040 [Jeotgalibacillus alimentarius]|uniref:YwpF protein n=1 Tax=Jeotgalibacillus alimentarius TaxID=135826 RepID=A0A0C2VL15_9BACL|nr:YwpF family protein [Jeotgalibacillus alimentarius]KIL44683.1 hypothetical protein KP77_29040 [Jeotgalibacillus alimentarius]